MPLPNSVDESSTLSAGLDALDSPPVDTRRRRSVAHSLAPVAALLLVVALWQLAVVLQVKPDYVIPRPSAVFDAMRGQHEQGILLPAALNSIRRALQGFALSVLIATPVGLLLGTNKTARALFRPILSGLQQLPSVAWVPAAIIWFGLSDATIYTVVLLGAIPSIANGLISGIDQIPEILLRVGRVLGANRRDNITQILLPAAWPGYLAGLEQGWAFAWRSLMAAELIAVSPALGPGLGQMLDVGRQLGDMALVVGSILTILVVGILIERLVFNPLRVRTLRRRGFVVQ